MKGLTKKIRKRERGKEEKREREGRPNHIRPQASQRLVSVGKIGQAATPLVGALSFSTHELPDGTVDVSSNRLFYSTILVMLLSGSVQLYFWSKYPFSFFPKPFLFDTTKIYTTRKLPEGHQHYGQGKIKWRRRNRRKRRTEIQRGV